MDASFPAPFDPGWPVLDEAPLRTGAKLFDSLEYQITHGQRLQCTLNFVFSDPNNTTLYVGTASHCVAGFSLGDKVALADGAATGMIAYCSFGTIEETDECPDLGISASEASANDFALIAIDPADRATVHPATFQIGGPTRMAPSPDAGSLAYTYGNTDDRDGRIPGAPDPLDARAGRVHRATDWTIEIVFDVTSVGRDSGSPGLAADGGALGVLQYGFTDQCPGPRIDVNGAVFLAEAVAFMHAETDLQVELKTWPLIDPPDALPKTPWPCDGRVAAIVV